MSILKANGLIFAFMAVCSHSLLAVEQEWVNEYSLGGRNLLSATTLDAAGNIYNVGQTIGPDSSYDFLTIKYLTDGTEAWARSYSGPTFGADIAKHVIVDEFANVYVSGTIAGTQTDVALVKYDESGNLLWQLNYDGTQPGYDFVHVMKQDSLGNIILAGRTSSLLSRSDYLITKVDSEGTVLWLQKFDSKFSNAADFLTHMVIDKDNNIVVTGYSDGKISTVKFSANGSVIWNQLFDERIVGSNDLRGLSVDADGNILILARELNDQNNFDFLTIKYSGTGSELWRQRYNNSDDTQDDPRQLSIDSLGNIIVSGGSINGQGLRDLSIIKYTKNGIQTWVKTVANPLGSHVGFFLNIDNADNVIVSGRIEYSNNNADIVTGKFDHTGVQQWINYFDGPANGFDNARALVIDDKNDVYVSGSSDGLGSSSDFITLKYKSHDGSYDWIQRYNNSANQQDIARFVQLDGNNNVIVTGGSYAGHRAITTLKYSQQTPFAFGGFLPPLTEGGVYKLGRVIPLKFQILDDGGQIVEDASPILSLQLIEDGEPSGDPIEPISVGPADDGNVFRFSDGIYIYNLAAENLTIGVYRISVGLGDGSAPKTIEIGFW